MQSFFDWARTSATAKYLAWRDARRARIIIHKAKTEWIFSGTARNDAGAMQDAGFLRSPRPLNRAQALRYFTKMFPRAAVVHVDDRNKVITYMFN